MKNKTSKVNKTKFDYICFRLGIVGLALFLLTIVIGGASLFNIINTNQELTVAMTQSASGFFLKRIAWMRPAKIGVEPIEITVPIATPINKTPLKKRI